jgi:hypothetical protein
LNRGNTDTTNVNLTFHATYDPQRRTFKTRPPDLTVDKNDVALLTAIVLQVLICQEEGR